MALTLGYVEEADFTLIKVGQTIKNEIDLSKFFKLSKDEIYTVQFKYGGLSSNIITINN